MYSVGVIMGSWGLIKSEESQAYFHLVESGVVAAAVVLTAGGASSRGEKKDETESTFGMKSTSRYHGKSYASHQIRTPVNPPVCLAHHYESADQRP